MSVPRPQAAAEHLPSRVIVELIEQCNYRCVHCFVPHRLKGPPTEVAAAIAAKIAAEGVPSISWTGGEPFLRSDLFDIASAAAGGTIQTVNTNGSLITPAIADRCADVFSLARVSLFGTAATVAAHTDHRTASYDTPMRAIERFLAAGLAVQANLPVIGRLDDIVSILTDLADRFGDALEEAVVIPVIKVGPVEGSPRGFADEKRVENDLDFLQDSTPFPIRFFTWKPGKHMLIKADARAYAHPIAGAADGVEYIGDPTTESITDIWARFPPEFIHAHRELTPSVDHLTTP